MSDALDKVLNNVDVKHRVYELARTWGAAEECASAFADNKASQFKFDGVALTWNVSGKLAVDDAECKAHFTQGPLKALFPTKGSTEQHPEIDPALLERARQGNKTARQDIYLKLGRDMAATDKLIAQKPTDDGTNKDSRNPWRAADFKTNKQAQAEAAGIIRRLGTRVASDLARSALRTLAGDPLRG